jgi:hypothetical protein
MITCPTNMALLVDDLVGKLDVSCATKSPANTFMIQNVFTCKLQESKFKAQFFFKNTNLGVS